MVNFMGRKVPKKSAVTAMLCIITILITCIFCICYLALTKQKADDTIDITVEIVYADESKQEFKINTARTTLEQALLDEGLIENSETDSGIYTVVDSVVVEKGAEWHVFVDGESTDLKFKDVYISDGDFYQIVYTHGKEK